MIRLQTRSAVGWLPWGPVAFQRAREEQKLLLLSIAAPWSAASREMDARCYADAAIAAEISRWFIAVRVDADRRPDIAERYDLGGLPTTAFIDSAGRLLGGGTFVPPERLLEALTRARTAPAIPHDDRHTGAATDAYEDAPSINEITASVFETFDAAHGGFGDAPKFPLVAPVKLALALYRDSGAEEMLSCAATTLDAMGWGELYDDDGGGFRRCAPNTDWTSPPPEKILSTNAALLDLYLEAGEAAGNRRWLERAAETLAFVQERLGLAPGEGWRASEHSDNARLTDANAVMAAAALRASVVFGDQSLRELALRSLESSLLASYRPGQGLAHCGGGVRGLLGDHVAMVAALLDAWDLTHDEVYEMMARELAHFMFRTLHDPNRGGFFDRPVGTDDELAISSAQLKPFVGNCDAATVFHRLDALEPEAGFGRAATAALNAIHGAAPRYGPLAAHYVLARRALSR